MASAASAAAAIAGGLGSIAGLFLNRPMRYWYVYGYWRGLDTTNICTSLSHYDSDFWRAQPQACNDIIDRQVHSFSVYIIASLYFPFLAYLLYHLYSLGSAVSRRYVFGSRAYSRAAIADQSEICPTPADETRD